MELDIRPLAETELAEAERIFRLAFGTFIGIPDPLTFTNDCAFIRSRWQIDPSAAFAAVADGQLVGTNFAAHWGTFSFFGPLTVRPDYWDRGVAHRLLDATMERMDMWRVTHAGLFTFPQSPKHVALYQRYGFYPRFLTVIASKPVTPRAAMRRTECFSALSPGERSASVAECRALTDSIHPGLDVSSEIEAVQQHALGDTVLLAEDGELAGFAVCHVGPGTEAGSGVCYAKFAAVRNGPLGPGRFERLLDLIERFAAMRGAQQLVAGVNTGRDAAYRALLANGFHGSTHGLAMQRPNEPAFNGPEAFVLDDWR
ncbi:MAG: GNAT family N-acetyltransferase [Candidatus Binatia bacterium]